LYGNIIIFDSIKGGRHFVELMVMGGKKGLGPCRMLMKVFRNCPGYGNSVVSTGTPAYFVKEDQASFGQIVKDGGGFVHLYHKSGVSHRDIVAGPYPSKNFIDIAHPNGFGRYKTAHLCQ